MYTGVGIGPGLGLGLGLETSCLSCLPRPAPGTQAGSLGGVPAPAQGTQSSVNPSQMGPRVLGRLGWVPLWWL